MIVKLLCRYQKDPSNPAVQQLEQELKTLAIIKGDAFNEDQERLKLQESFKAYDYGPFTFDLRDVSFYNEVDKDHVCIRFRNNSAFTFKVSHLQFEAIYQTLTGMVVNDFTGFQKIVIDKKPTKKNAKG